MPMTTNAASIRAMRARTSQQIDALEIALTEEEIASATMLEFDPDATLPHNGKAAHDEADPIFHAIPGHYYSLATWSRLAVGACGGRPSDALERFLRLRARSLL